MHAPVFQPEAAFFFCRCPIEAAIDVKLFGYASGTFDPFNSADEDGGRPVSRTNDQVKHLMNAVTKIHVPDATRFIKWTGALGSSGAGVAGKITFPIVGFHLRDQSGHRRGIS